MTNSAPTRRRRRWWKVAAALLIVVVCALAAFPVLLCSAPGRRWILEHADRALAPSRLQFDTLRLSWFGPTAMTGFVLIDAEGDRVVAASRAHWNRNLWQILFDRPRYGVLVLSGAALDVERMRDGSIDLYETLKPIISRDPRLDLTIQVSQGTLRFRSPGVFEPVLAEKADLTLRLPAAPEAISWSLRMANETRPEAESIQIRGTYDRWRAVPNALPDLAVSLTAQHWPMTLDTSLVQARGRGDGQVEFSRHGGRWGFSGDGSVSALDATSSVLAGDHLRLARIRGTWDLAETPDAWTIRRLDLSSSIGSIKAQGELPAPPGSATRIEGKLDLAALAKQLPHALRLREGLAVERGSAQLQVDARTESSRQNWDVVARVSDLIARNADQVVTLHEPATLSASLVRQGSDLRVERFGLKTAFLDASASGDLDRGIDLAGTIDLAGVERQLRDLVDFGDLELAGRGSLTGHYQRAGLSYDGRLAAKLNDLRIAGLGSLSVARDELRLDTDASGPADDLGLPRGWKSAHGTLQSGGVKADVTATAGERGADLLATASVPIALAGHAGRADGNFSGRWADRAVEIDEVRIGLIPSELSPPSEPVTWSARGRFDSTAGELVLEPSGAPGVRAIELAPDGVRISGLQLHDASLRAEGGFAGDVATLSRAIADWTGQPFADLEGRWSTHWTARATDDGLHLGAKLELNELSWPRADRQHRRTEAPMTLALRAVYHGDSDRIDVPELVFANQYATLDASGRLSDLGGQQLVDIKGTLLPDWKTINAVLAERVEPDAQIKGTARPFHVTGALAGDSPAEVAKGLDAEFGFDLVSADFYGMHVGPAPIVLRSRAGQMSFDPIRTTLNNGRLKLDPKVEVGDEGGVMLRLAPGSVIEGAEVNAEVSRRVLTFVAPVLQEATRVSGFVSMAVDRAEFPIGSNARAGAIVEGQVVFRDVEFLPGPLADELLDLVGRTDKPRIKLDQPVLLTIADGRVIQQGFAIPLGGVTKIEVEGAVDFDRNLDLTASLPLTSKMVGNNPLLSEIVGGTRIAVPIGGTLSQPKVDRQALGLGLKDLGKTLLERSVLQGAAALLERMARPRDPNAPPPPPRLSREERKAKRLEKKAQKRRERGQEP